MIVSTGAVRSNENLAKILADHRISNAVNLEIQKNFAQIYDLRKLQPGHSYAITTSTDGVFLKFAYQTDPIRTYLITRSSQGVYGRSQSEAKTVWREKRITGEVTEFLYKDLLKNHEETFVANLVADLADNIFAWRIDFFTEQRPGDKYDILMEQEFIEGSDTPLWGGRGRILVASYTGKSTKQKENLAFRYQAPGAKWADYFDEEGKAVRKAFLRAPFTLGVFRISSGFNRARLHPILRTYRPHHGTDYAARTGTPVVSIGNGTVILAGWKGGYGNCVEVRHSNKYVSRYGHLSRILVKPGMSVLQGRHIGNVGATGLATGPHLHFEMLVDGVQRNFLTMNFPSASSVSEKDMPEFRQAKDVLLARINGNGSALTQVSQPTTESRDN